MASDTINLYGPNGFETKKAPKLMNPDGSPVAPEFNSIADDMGKLNPAFAYNAQTLNPNSLAGFQKYKTESMRDGPSQWANTQGQIIDAQKQQGLDKNATNAQTQLQSLLSNIGSKGNHGGSAAMMGADLGKANMFANQGTFQNANMNKLNVASQDETNRVNQLGAFSDAEAKLGQYNTGIQNDASKLNIQNQLSELGAGRDFNKYIYGEDMKKWAADRTALAMENAAGKGGGGSMFDKAGKMVTDGVDFISNPGKNILGANNDLGKAWDVANLVTNPIAQANAVFGGGGSWVCTKIHEAVKLSLAEGKALFRLRRFALRHNEGLARAYLYEYSPLTEAMSRQGVDFKDYKWFIDECVKLVEAGKMKEAFAFYTEKIFGMISKFWPECQDQYFKRYIQTGEF
jgi:hypothetical protein